MRCPYCKHIAGVSDRSGLAIAVLVEHIAISFADFNVVLGPLPEDYVLPPARIQTPPEIFIDGAAHDWAGREGTLDRALRTLTSFRRMTLAAFSCSRRWAVNWANCAFNDSMMFMNFLLQ